MIQIHGNTISPMGFNPMIKAHDSNLWQIIRQKVQFPLAISKARISLAISKAQFLLAISKAQSSLAISKAKFSLVISKPNSHWQYRKPNLCWHYFIKKPKIINTWQRKNIMV